ncbi:MAG TPA: chloramphenicol acetyltransferase [Flavobacterium sp.]|nr:chloramphenicol acetyltransferase [Flavobacterium sp.]
MNLKNRLQWILFRRKILKTQGIITHITSYVDDKSILLGPNSIGKNSHIINSKIGRHSYVVNARIVNTQIGSFSSVGANVSIGGLGKHPTKWISTHPIFYSTKKQSGDSFVSNDLFKEHLSTRIGNDVWIGNNVLILDGITIDDGAIIGAGAVVTKDIPPYSIYGGVPAKCISSRTSPEIAAALKELAWWDLDDNILRKISPLFTMTEVSLPLIRLIIDQINKIKNENVTE